MAKFSTFKATNSLSTKNLYNERLKYEVGIFDNAIPSKPIVKFYLGEFQFYGKVDELLDSVSANKKRLKLLSNNDKNLFAFDFVVDQYKLMTQNFSKCQTMGTIKKDDPYLSLIKPFKAYQGLDTEWENYIKKILISFNKDYIIGGNRLRNVVDFKTYMEHLIEYNKVTGKIIPLTKENFIKTNMCPLNVSGLVIEIAELDYSKDTLKYNFINSPNFEFYKNVCIKYGFSIDFNAPWRLIADIDSPPMLEAMQRLGYNRQTIFNSHFEKVITSEITNIKNTLHAGYSMLLKNSPISSYAYECGKKLRNKIIERNSISKTEINNIVDDKTALEIFIILRASEQENQLSEKFIQNLKNDSFSYLGKLGLQQAVTYVNEQMKTNQLTNSGTFNTIFIQAQKRNRG